MVKKKNKKKNKKTPPFDIKLNINHERFCRLYTKNSALFGNATQCYAQAYGYDLESLSTKGKYSQPDENGLREKIEDSPYEKSYNVCSVEGKRLLSYPKINEYINKLLNELMTDENADAELAWVMQQREDLSPKVQALREYNKIKGRITDKVKLEGLNLKALHDAIQNND